MKKETKQLLSIGGYMAKWLLITAIIGLLWGRYPPFLKESHLCNRCSFANPWLLFIPPLAVSFYVFLYAFGKNASRGNNE